jgi:hypothetical protein
MSVVFLSRSLPPSRLPPSRAVDLNRKELPRIVVADFEIDVMLPSTVTPKGLVGFEPQLPNMAPTPREELGLIVLSALWVAA